MKSFKPRKVMFKPKPLNRARTGLGVACVLCPSSNPKTARHSHHTREVSKGGAIDGKQIPLCESCHGELHRLASMVSSGRLSLEALKTKGPLWKYVIEELVDQRRLYDSGQVKATDARRIASASLSEEEHRRFKVVAKTMGLSQENTLRALILAQYARIVSGRS